LTGGRRISARAARFAAIATACAAGLGGTALAAFPDDPPNDPQYNPAEQGGPGTCSQKSVNDEERYFYSFMPMCAPGATDPENASGGSEDRAWKQFTPGDGHTVIAYIEGGINWHDFGPDELANKVFLNAGELPKPTTPKHDHVRSAEDYADTKDTNGNGLVDPEDIIKRFSDGKDDDHNGYTDDISGWDFYDGQNDPATVDATYDHANGQEQQAAAQTDNGSVGAGTCPKCMILPIKAGPEALDREDDLAQAWLYASDMNADVLVSVTGELGYASFMRQAVKRVWRKGTVMVEASNDFDSTDHQGGMWWPYVLPGNGMVANSTGLELAEAAPGDAAVVNGDTKDYRERSGYSSWGTHNVFTVAAQGGTTSEDTPTVGGTMGLVLSYGKDAARQHLIKHPLSADEAIQVVRATSSDVNDSSLSWPNGPGWDLQYGYGRPNVFEAMKAIHDGSIPPEAWIDSPGWYRLYDPTKTGAPVRGHVAAPRSGHYSYKLQFAPGAEPAEGEFMTAGRGAGTRPFNGKLGKLDLSKVPESFWSKAFDVSQTKTLETNEQYTVTIRLQVKDAHGRVGEDRRSIAVAHDPSWAKGFPKYIGHGGDAQPALADLQHRGDLAIVFGDSDGIVHAIDGRSGHSLPGWPVHTRRTRVERAHPGIDPGHEPIIDNVAVGDLNGDGNEDVVATSTTGRVYAWNARGHPLKGWPKTMDRGVQKPAIPRPADQFTRLPQQGATAPPVLYDLNGDGKLEVVQGAWDGHLYAWKPNGKPLAGWPVKAKLPASYQPPSGHLTVKDFKVDTPPAIGDIDGDGKPEIVVHSQQNDIVDAGLQPGLVGHLLAYHADGSPVDGFPVNSQALFGYYGSAQEFITEGVSDPSMADVDGDGDQEIAFAPGIFSPTYLYGGDGSELGTYGPIPSDVSNLISGGFSLQELVGLMNGQTYSDSPVNFTASGAFGKFGPGDQLSFAEPESGGTSVARALLLAGSGAAITNYETAFNALTQAKLPGFPSTLQGLDFLGGPLIADVTGDGKAEIINTADSSALQAFDSTGGAAAAFPKFTTGWMLWAPSVGDVDSDGRSDLVGLTREGYLFVWKTKGDPSGNDEWWSYRHDERNTGAYGTDTRPPGKLRRVRFRVHGKRLNFKAPGDDWYAGKVDHYAVHVRPGAGAGGSLAKRMSTSPTVQAGHKQRLELPAGWKSLKIWAVDDAGNRGPTLRKVRHR
jgi:hypothetical protein